MTTRVTYAPAAGSPWTIVAGPEAWLLVALSSDDPRVPALQQALATAEPVDEVLDVLLADGVRRLPGFAAVGRHGDRLRYAVRAPAGLEIASAAGDEHVAPSAPWTEGSVATEPDRLVLSSPASGEGELVLEGGAAPAGLVLVELSTAAADLPAPPAAPPPGVAPPGPPPVPPPSTPPSTPPPPPVASPSPPSPPAVTPPPAAAATIAPALPPTMPPPAGPPVPGAPPAPAAAASPASAGFPSGDAGQTGDTGSWTAAADPEEPEEPEHPESLERREPQPEPQPDPEPLPGTPPDLIDGLPWLSGQAGPVTTSPEERTEPFEPFPAEPEPAPVEPAPVGPTPVEPTDADRAGHSALAGRLDASPAPEAAPQVPPAPPAAPTPPPAAEPPAPVPHSPTRVRDRLREEVGAPSEAAPAEAGDGHAMAPTVWAVLCPQGHPGPPYSVTCRVCRTAVPEQNPVEIPRPSLGRLVLSTGGAVTLDRDVVLGRAPRSTVEDAAARPHLVRLTSTEVSRMHAEVLVDGWQVLVRDLGSVNGTTLTLPGGVPQQLRAHEEHPVEPGSVITLSDVVTATFEVTG